MHLLNSITLLVTQVTIFAGPVLLAAWASRKARPDFSRLLGAVTLVVLVGAVLAWRVWYFKPDYAGSPIASIATVLVLQLPSLLSTAALLALARQRSWSRGSYLLVPIVGGYLVLLAASVPALLVFVTLGGDTL